MNLWIWQLTSLLAELGLNIQEAHAFSTVDGYSLDVFVVDGWPYEVHLWRYILTLIWVRLGACYIMWPNIKKWQIMYAWFKVLFL